LRASRSTCTPAGAARSGRACAASPGLSDKGGLYFGETIEGGDTLVVVHAVGAMYDSVGRVLAFGLGGDAPIYRNDRFAGTVELGVTKGPAGEPRRLPLARRPFTTPPGPATRRSA
jgi:hypothetical protein